MKCLKQELVADRFNDVTTGQRILSITSRFGVYIMILLLLMIGAISYPKIFLTIPNLLDIIEVGSMLGVASIGVAFITFSGNFCDMSAPGIMAFSGIMAVQFLPYGIITSVIIAVVSGTIIGVLNGFMVGKLKANPIIWCLAVQFVLTGILRWIFNGKQIYPDMMPNIDLKDVDVFFNIYRAKLFGLIPLVVIIFIMMIIVFQFILTKTRFGQQLKTTGSNASAAKCSGINTQLIIGATFAISAFTCSIAGLMLSSLSKVGAYYMGEGYDFNTITAIVLGGVTLMGGRGSILGVAGGVITLGILNNLMTFVGLGTFEQLFVKGLVFIAIVWFNSFSLRKLGKDYV